MTDVIALNVDGATHPGALAVVHPGVLTPGGQLTIHRVVEESGEYMRLTDGHVYCKRSGGPKGYYGHPTLTHRVALTQGSPMFAAWAVQAHDPESRFVLPHRTGSTAVDRGAVPALRRARLRRALSCIGR